MRVVRLFQGGQVCAARASASILSSRARTSSGFATPTPLLRAGSSAKRSPCAGWKPNRSGVCYSSTTAGSISLQAKGLSTQGRDQRAFENLIGPREKVNEFGNSTHNVSKTRNKRVIHGQALARVEPTEQQPIPADRKIPNVRADSGHASGSIGAEEDFALAPIAGVQRFVASVSIRATARVRNSARGTRECLDRADFASQGRGFEEQRVIARERHVGKHVLQILGVAQGVRGR